MNDTKAEMYPKGKLAESKESKIDFLIDEKFKNNFDLEFFLKKCVADEEYMKRNKTSRKISSDKELIDFIIGNLQAKKYIGVGVGGVYIENIHSNECVLLYKRYHEPEDQMWSILGGSSKIHEGIEETLKKKISRITKISRDAIEVQDIIRANNHEETDFHYLSPAFYVDIKNLSSYLYWDENVVEGDKRKKVEIIEKVDDLLALGKSTYENPLLAWVPTKIIYTRNGSANRKRLFAFTTVKAIEMHNNICEETKKIVDATENLKSYKSWRIKNL